MSAQPLAIIFVLPQTQSTFSFEAELRVTRTIMTEHANTFPQVDQPPSINLVQLKFVAPPSVNLCQLNWRPIVKRAKRLFATPKTGMATANRERSRISAAKILCSPLYFQLKEPIACVSICFVELKWLARRSHRAGDTGKRPASARTNKTQF